MRVIKCVVIGDGTVGKTSLIMTFCTNEFPSDSIPAVFDNYSSSVYEIGMRAFPSIIDTISLDEYKKQRISSYQQTDVFIVCFSLISPTSMQNVESFWIPEIKKNCPNVPFILVGTKSDLRDNFTEDKAKGYKPISKKEGEKLKEKMCAKEYIECSSLKQCHIKDVFDSAIKYGVDYQKSLNKANKKQCLIE